MTRDRESTTGTVALLAEAARFVWRLMRDRRTPLRVKLLMAALGVYLVSPIDIIPDGIPVLGALDDAAVAAAALALAVRWAPRELVDELWQADIPFEDALRRLKDLLRRRRRKAGRA